MFSYILGYVSVLMIFFMSALYLGIVIVDIFNAPSYFSLIFPALFLLLQYFFFPSLLSKIFVKIQFADKNAKIEFFEKKMSSKKNIKIIFWDMDYPVMFHYGSIFTPTTCVVSLGLLNVLSDEEISALTQIELAKINVGVRHLFMTTALIPFCMFHISQYLGFLGSKHKVVGGAGSIISFAAFLSVLAQVIYIPLYIVSRSVNKLSRVKVDCNEFLNKISCAREIQLPQKLTDLIFSLNFIDILDPSIPFRKSRNYHFFDYTSSIWKDYIDLFHSHELPEHQTKNGKSVSNKKDYIFVLLLLTAIILLLTSISYNFNFYTSVFLFIFGLFLLILHITQRPFKKSKISIKEIVDEKSVSPLKGYYAKIEGNFVRYPVSTIGERFFAVNTAEYHIPLSFFSVNKPNISIDENEKIELIGYFRKSEVIEFEPTCINKNNQSVYRSHTAQILIAFDLLLMLLSSMMIIFLYKGG